MVELGLLLLCIWPQSLNTLPLRFSSLLGMQARI
ncbi:unnamed protein product [Linum tenue]|uniref:Uncharacterized protein n=1 Tax=Linum tenue TaxID=586396 RepID=A0AAV0MT47_9ROSI|nr:unnamed protein product [Linum tenue]